MAIQLGEFFTERLLFMPQIYSKIIGTGSALPERSTSNQALADELALRNIETSDEWIRTRTGIEKRYLAERGLTTTQLAERAARSALWDAGVDPSEIDLIIVATTTPDMVFPSTACQLQKLLGCAKGAAFDLQAVCAGFIYALTNADALIRTGVYKKAIVVGVDIMSRIVDWDDRSTCVLFGDGAGAVVLEASDEPGILAARLSADGTLDEKVLGCTGFINGGEIHGDPFVRMDGQQVFRMAVGSMSESAQAVLKDAGLTVSDISRYVPHQANLRIMQKVAQKIGIPEDKMVVTVNRHGNTSAASVPLALDNAARHNDIQQGDVVLMQAVGAGMAWGSVLVRWTKEIVK